MSLLERSTARAERVIALEVGSETVIGVMTQPAGTPGVGTIVVSGVPFGTSAQRNGWATNLCRTLAAQGVVSLRLDWHGCGESSGDVTGAYAMDDYAQDLEAAIAFLEDNGVHRIVVVGRCLGAWAGLAAAKARDSVQGVVLLAPEASMQWGPGASRPNRLLKLLRRRDSAALSALRRLVRRVKPARRPVQSLAPELVASLESAATRQTALLVIHCEGDPARESYEAARHGALGRLLDRPGVQMTTLPGAGGILERVDRQEESLRLIVEWIGQTTRAEV